MSPIFIWIFSVNASFGPLIDDSTWLSDTALLISALVSIASILLSIITKLKPLVK